MHLMPVTYRVGLCIRLAGLTCKSDQVRMLHGSSRFGVASVQGLTGDSLLKGVRDIGQHCEGIQQVFCQLGHPHAGERE